MRCVDRYHCLALYITPCSMYAYLDQRVGPTAKGLHITVYTLE